MNATTWLTEPRRNTTKEEFGPFADLELRDPSGKFEGGIASSSRIEPPGNVGREEAALISARAGSGAARWGTRRLLRSIRRNRL